MLRRGFQLQPGERVVIVEDIVTTGGSALQVVELAKEHGADVLGVGLLVDRSGGNANFGVDRVEPLLRMNIETFAPDEVPAELKIKEIVQDELSGEWTERPASIVQQEQG